MCEKDRCDQKCSGSSPASASSVEGDEKSVDEKDAVSRPPKTKCVAGRQPFYHRSWSPGGPCCLDFECVCVDCVARACGDDTVSALVDSETGSCVVDETTDDRDDPFADLRDKLLVADETTDDRVMSKVAEFVDEYPRRAELPVSSSGKLNSKYVDYVEESWVASDYQHGSFSEIEMSEFKPDRAVSWADAVVVTLERFLCASATDFQFTNGVGDEFWKSAETRWMRSYQSAQYAEMQSFVRRLCGGDYSAVSNVSDDRECEGRFESPKVFMLTRSSSAGPDGSQRAPGDHNGGLAGSWRGVYDTMRNALERFADAWAYDAREEPHPGSGYGINACYGHEHIIGIVDTDDSALSVRAKLRSVVEKHVDVCGAAGAEAHDLDKTPADWGDSSVDIDTVQVFDVDDDDDIEESIAAYAASYASIDPKSSLLERDIEYVAWASVKDATNTRAVRRSEVAREVSALDRCDILGWSDESHQPGPHGSRVERDDDSFELKCAHCGESHGIEQPGVFRVDDEPDVVADGGSDIDWNDGPGWVSADDDGSVSVGAPAVSDYVADYIRETYSDASLGDVFDIAAEMNSDGWNPDADVVNDALGVFAETDVDELRSLMSVVTDEFSDASSDDLARIAGSLSGRGVDFELHALAACLDCAGGVDALLSDVESDYDPAVVSYIREHYAADSLRTTSGIVSDLRDRRFCVSPRIVAFALGFDAGSWSVSNVDDSDPDSDEWCLESIVYDRDTDSEETALPGGSGVEMVDVETDIDEYRGLFTGVLLRDVDAGAVPVTWRFRDGFSVGCASWSGESVANYIEREFDVDADYMTVRDSFEYVRPMRSMEFGPVDSVWDTFDRDVALDMFSAVLPGR